MKTEQYERILKALERTAELLKDDERARRAGRLLVYPSIQDLQTDVNELRDEFKRNRLFLIDIADSLDGINIEPLPEIEPLDFSDLPDLNNLEPLDFKLESD